MDFGCSENLQKPMAPSLAVIVDWLRFHSLSCIEFPVSVWLGARCTRMQFTRFADRSTTSKYKVRTLSVSG